MSGVYFASIDPIYSCGDCPFRDCDDYCARFEYRVMKSEKPRAECGLINIPNHGRLGDLDALAKLFKEKAAENGGIGGMMVALAALCIDAAPTIIPAEKEG